jgi:phosphoglucosamine mutase
MLKRYFGTDGIRSKVGSGAINPEFVLKLGWAAGKVFGRGPGSKVIIGKDTRISGYMLESALESGLAAAGVDILLLGPMPTPAVAYLTQTFRADLGIVISASHNPYYDNGIKFFGADGKKISDDLELEIESYLSKQMTTIDSQLIGKASRVNDAPGRYIEFCKHFFPARTSLTGLKLVVDCANGATYHIAPNVLRELGADVVELGVDPDGLNINANCGSTKPEILQKIVLVEQADLGIAFDGDGDRVLMVDHLGEIVDGDELLYIMTRYALMKKNNVPGVVGTVMSNLGLEQSIQALGLEFVRSAVGDRNVVYELQKRHWQLGGESSGHLINLECSTTGDGIIAALQVLAAIKCSELSLHELKSGMHKYPQKQFSVKMAKRMEVEESPMLEAIVEKVALQLGSTGRVLLRPSGTEAVMRIMIEGEDLALIEKLGLSMVDEVSAVLSVPS